MARRAGYRGFSFRRTGIHGVGDLAKKIGIIDIGTYSTRFLISAIHKKDTLEETLNSIEDILSVGRITSLGRGLKESGKLSEEAMAETLAVLKEYKMLADEYHVDYLKAYATQACREAENGQEFIKRVKELEIDVEIINGEKEAYLSFLATAYGIKPDSSFIMIDQGGGSTEFAYGEKVESKYTLKTSKSFPFGIVGLTEMFIKHDPPKPEELEKMREFIKNHIQTIYPDMKDAKELIGLGGTITTLVALENNIFPYSSEKVHGKKLTKQQVEKWLKELASIPTEERKKIPQIEDKRAEVILAGIVIFDTAMDVFNKEQITVSDWGLRHGAVINFVLENYPNF